MDDDAAHEHLVHLTDEFEESLREHKVECIRCGSHTINLVVNDVTSASERDDDALKHIVKIVKSYRRAEYKKAFKITKTSMPPIPNKTRWNVYYSMATELLENREFFTDMGSQYKEQDLSDYWSFLEEYQEAFQPLYEASMRSQKMECGISQFHLEWLKAFGKVKSLKTNRFTSTVLQSMAKRQQTMTSNIAYKAALFMDPRFSYNGSELFKTDEKTEVVAYLIGVWKKINANFPDVNTEQTSKSDTDTGPMDSSFDINDFFTELFGQGTSARSQAPNSLEEKLHQIQYQDRVNPANENFNVIHYWYTQKVRDERLWKIAQVVYAAASSQAAVERDFSAYNLIFTNSRNRLAGDTIESV
ncbi:zinc finger BED domain-containing protein 4-like [Aedes albopictus]|uniref:HAT C-terminal dimerisation domain-containing protein n=1 Tax=Aedes albopictus TaxID=7160 RepID=A0ABM1XMH4_AEDAL